MKSGFAELNVERADLSDPRQRGRYGHKLLVKMTLSISSRTCPVKIKTEKGIRWMPWYYEPMKDAVTGEMPRGAGKQALIRGCPNGETYMCEAHMPLYRGIY